MKGSDGEVDLQKMQKDAAKAPLTKMVEAVKSGTNAQKWQTGYNAAFAEKNLLEFIG